MIVRIRFGRGHVFTRRPGTNAKAARAAADFFTLISISSAILAAWRLGIDLGFTRNFVFADGLLSHWQVWIAATVAVEYAGWWLTRYSELAIGHALAHGSARAVTDDLANIGRAVGLQRVPGTALCVVLKSREPETQSQAVTQR